MKHYLITGGAGFIGSNLIKTIFEQEEGIRISCVDNFDPFYSADIKHLNIRSFATDQCFKLINCDLATVDHKKLGDLITDPVDTIIHLAAKAGVRPSIENPLAYQRANVIGLQNMLDYAKEKGIKQFVFASSSSVYGINDHFPWKEEEQLLPISPYAMTKLAGEMLGHVYHKLFGIRFLALRFFTVYGPGQRPDLAIHKFTRAILTKKPVTLYGDGNTGRDYTFIDDTVSGIMAAIQYDKSDFEIVNLGNNYSISLAELVSSIEKVTGETASIQRLANQPGDVPRTCADISKAQKLFNYHPQTKLLDGLKKFTDWFVRNQDVLTKGINN